VLALAMFIHQMVPLAVRPKLVENMRLRPALLRLLELLWLHQGKIGLPELLWLMCNPALAVLLLIWLPTVLLALLPALK